MKMKKQAGSRGFWAAALFLLIAAFALLPMRPQAAANKAARLKISCDGKTDDWDQGTYSLMTMLPKTGKIKPGMTVTYKVYVPTSLLKKEGDALGFCMDLNLWIRDKKSGYYQGIGSVYKTRWVFISKEGKNVSLSVYNEHKDKNETSLTLKGTRKASGKYVSAQKKGKYYVITMKDVLGSTYYDYKTGKDKKINTKTTYTLVPEFVVHDDYSRKASGYVYLDEFTYAAAKTQKVTYNKKDYKEIYARHFGGTDWHKNWKLVTM